MKKNKSERQYELVDHLLEVGWKVNHEYLDNIVINKYDGDLKRAMWGKHESKFYLISNCENYTCTIERNMVRFWKMKPNWMKLGDFRIGPSLQLTEKGILSRTNKGGAIVKTIELILPEFKQETSKTI